jgi:predicted DNA-binding transcriptional regulator AlpA
MAIPVIVRQDELPRILFVEQLSALIGKTPTTIRTCATNAKYQHLIPKPFKMPHSRRLCWYEQEVLEWIDSQRPAPEPVRRRRGRPTKVAQLSRLSHEESMQKGR